MSKHNYQSDVILGERYRDKQTGFEGIATAVYFFQHACERVALETYDAERKEVKDQTFDAPRLVSVETGQAAKSDRPGGPGRNEGQRTVNAR